MRRGRAREQEIPLFVEGGNNRRERTIYTSEKGYISLECKREERAETQREEGVRSTSDDVVVPTKVVRGASEEQYGMENGD